MRHVLLLVCLLCAAFAAWGRETALLKPATAGEFRKQFTFLTDGWQAEARGLVGTSPRYHSLPDTALESFPDDPWTYFTVHPVNLWRYAIAGEPEWTDYTLTATVTVQESAPLKGFRPGCYFFNYQWGREAIGSDAGLIVRYTDPDNYYMARISTGYDHLELWKTHGGVVRVAPCQFAPNRAYTIRVTASGRWITVAVDGKEIIRYADPVMPLRHGRAGIGVRESRVRFDNIQVLPAAHSDTPLPVHEPQFSLRKWVDRDYIFDGDEPIGFIFPGPNGLAFAEVKLAPGLMPLLTPYAGMQSYSYAPEYTHTVTRKGKIFAITFKLHEKDGGFACEADWTITYDPARGYVWDKRAVVTVLKDKALTSWPELDDPFFYQLVAPVTDKLPKCNDGLNYCLKQIADGTTVAYPAATHIWGDGVGGIENGPKMAIRPGGCVVTTVDGWGVVTELPADNTHRHTTGYCHWGLDQHIKTLETKAPAQGDVYTGHVRFSLWTPERVRQEMARSVFLQKAMKPTYDQTLSPYLIAHTEPVNHCANLYPGLTGEAVRLWTGNYTIDRAVGRGDNSAMRVDAGTITKRLNGAWGDDRPNVWLGPTYWTGPYLAPRYRFGIWVKAEAFTGKVVYQADSWDWVPEARAKFPVARAELPIQGKCDWTYLSFETSAPRQVFNWSLRIDPVGTGVIWVDDIDVTPLAK